MDKKKRKVYTPAEKRRRNRRHNAIVTSIAVVLLLAGIIIIVSDTTFFFDDAGRWIRRNIFGEVFETIPPFPTGRPSDPSDPDDPNNPHIGPQGSLVPRPTFSPDETPLPENTSTALRTSIGPNTMQRRKYIPARKFGMLPTTGSSSAAARHPTY